MKGYDILHELKVEIDKIIKLGNEGILTGKKAQDLQKQLRNPNLLEYIEDEIIKLKFEKLQNSIETIWSNREGYTGGGIFEKRSELIILELGKFNIIDKQKYFGEGQEQLIYNKLKVLFPIAKNKIIICDNYFSIELLKILSEVNKNVKVQILTKEKVRTNKLEKQIESFKILYEIGIDIKYISNGKHPHDRFYIIDNNVYNIGASVGKKIKPTMFSPIVDDEGKKIIEDFNEWWDN